MQQTVILHTSTGVRLRSLKLRKKSWKKTWS